MRYLFYLPALFFFLLPLVYALHQSAAARRAARAKEEKRRAAAAAKEAAEQARKAAKQARAAADPCALEAPRKRGRPCKNPAPEQRPETISTVETVAAPAPVVLPSAPVAAPVAAPERKRPNGNGAFCGQVVAFTGTIPGMSRAEAIQAVESNGGKAFETMPAATTILVVGDKPGNGKLDKADRWMGHIRKITAAQFLDMLKQPGTFSPDEFAAMIA